MPTARVVPRGGDKKKGSYCKTADGDMIPPGMRLLLKCRSPKAMIEQIQCDRPITAWETAALGLLKNEDAGTKIAFATMPSVVQTAEDYVVAPRQGLALMAQGVRIDAGTVNVGTPNVDISQRIAPAKLATPHTGVHNVHRLYLAAAFRVLLSRSNTGVAAVIVSASGEILACGKKNAAHPLLHAETSALMMYGKPLPAGARIYSTLKPCKMCRAAIAHFSTGNHFMAYYGQDDQTSAANGAMDVDKFVLMASGNPIERPIWADNDKGRNRLLRASAAQKLHQKYTTAHDKNRNLGIIDHLRNGDQDAQLRMAAGYLALKQKKYDDPRRSGEYNDNVQRCLAHITQVLTQLGIPVSA